MKRDSDIICLSQEHYVYIILGAICILIYYPTCTFFFPNFQFQNKLLDLKYKPTWFVIFIQVKLILACKYLLQFLTLDFISFFKSSTGTTDSIAIQLFGIVSIYTFLAIAVLYFKPCLVKKFNLWDIAIYCIIAYVTIPNFVIF